jgi:hypothetical protein
VPEEEHAVRPAQKTAAVDDVGPAVQDGLEELRILPGIVFQVGVLDKDDIALGVRESRLQRPSLAGVLLVEENLGLRRGEFRKDLARPVGRPVIDDDDLLLQTDVDGLDPAEDFLDRVFLVEDGDDDGKF